MLQLFAHIRGVPGELRDQEVNKWIDFVGLSLPVIFYFQSTYDRIQLILWVSERGLRLFCRSHYGHCACRFAEVC